MHVERNIKVLISGASFVNKGAEAMLRTVQFNLIQRFPSITFFVWGVSGYGREACNRGLIPLQLPFTLPESPFFRFGPLLGKYLWCLHIHFKAYRSGMRNILPICGNIFHSACLKFVQHHTDRIDAVIDISGFAYGDTWGLNYFKRIAPLLFISNRVGCPHIFLPQAWGPFEDIRVRSTARKMLARPNVTAYARDSKSFRYLHGLFKGEKNNIKIYPDVVFGFPQVSRRNGKALLKTMGCEGCRPIIGVAPNMKVYERAKGLGSENSYLYLLIELSRMAIEQLGADVVLHSNEIYKQQLPSDDRFLCALIQSSVNCPEHCFMTDDVLTAEDCISLIGHFDLMVGSRYHALVFALSQGIPCIAISWAHKYKELFKNVSQERVNFPVQHAEPEIVKEALNEIWKHRDPIGQSILNNAFRLNAQVNKLFDETHELIKLH